MGAIEQAKAGQIRHRIANSGRRERPSTRERQRARANRNARFQIALDDIAKNIARAGIQIRKRHMRSREGHSGYYVGESGASFKCVMGAYPATREPQ